jgi:hypothetical protein
MRADEHDLVAFRRGDRVRLYGNPIGATLTAHTGRVVAADPESDGNYLIALDSPARDWDTDDELPGIVVAAFNLELESARRRT